MSFKYIILKFLFLLLYYKTKKKRKDLLKDSFENYKKEPSNSVYLTNTFKKSKGVIADLLIFKIYHIKTAKQIYLLIEVEPNKTSFEITNMMLTKRKEKFSKIYKVNLNKNLMGTKCLFAGKDLFKNSITTGSTVKVFF